MFVIFYFLILVSIDYFYLIMEVNHNRIKNYPFGYLGLDYLNVNGNLYLHSQLLNNNRIRGGGELNPFEIAN